MSSFRDNHNGFSLSDVPVLFELDEKGEETECVHYNETHTSDGFTHLLLPLACFRWSFGNKNEIRSSPVGMRWLVILIVESFPNLRHTSHQSQPTAVSAHDLEHERSLVGSGSGVDTIDSFADSMQRGRSTNRQIGHGHVVIDRPDESNDFKVPMQYGLGLRDFSC